MWHNKAQSDVVPLWLRNKVRKPDGHFLCFSSGISVCTYVTTHLLSKLEERLGMCYKNGISFATEK